MFFSDFSIHKNNLNFQQRTKPCVTLHLFEDISITHSEYLVKKYTIGDAIYFVFGVLLGDSESLLKKEDYLNCNGNFLIVKFNNNNIHVITSRLNTMHCYHSATGIHTFYQNALPECKSLDWVGLGSYFTNGFFHNNRTFVNEVKLLLNACEYIYDSNFNLITKKNYWEFKQNLSNKSFEENVDTFAEILDQIKDDYLKLDGTLAMPISGGLDSRTITGLFSKTNKDIFRLWSYSYGFGPKSIETKISEEIAKKRGINFKKIVTSNYLEKNIPLIQNCVEHFQYIDGTRQAEVSEILKRNSTYVVCAHWGDVWNETMGYSSEFSVKDFAVKKLKKKGSQWFIDQFDKSFFIESEKELEDSLNLNLGDDDFGIKRFKSLQWSQRWTLASTRMYQAGAFPLYPFYDNRVIDFFCTVPFNQLSGRKIQVEYLKKYHPDLAKIKWQEYNSNLYWYKIFNNRNIFFRIINKLKRTFSSNKLVVRNWELFYLNSEGKSMLKKNIVDNKVLYRYIPKNVLEQFYHQFYAKPNAENGYTMSMLHTFSLFLSKYFQ
jgi:asparagine synthase (glutamine-hydrolysing)